MPSSEVTPTIIAPLQTAPLLPAEDSVVDDKTQSSTPRQLPAVRREWEEPHPGHRFSYPPARSVGRLVGEHHHHAIMGAHAKLGMAAKYTPYSSRVRMPGFGPRRLIRSRLRPTSFKALRLPSLNRDNDPTSPPPYTPQSSAPSTAPIFKRPASIEFAQKTMDIDTTFDETSDTDGFSRPLSCAIETITSSELSSPRLSMTDFSNHLGIALEAGAFNRTGSKPEHDSREYLHVPTPEGDPYGWEAELSKKLTCSDLEYRRAGGARRSLLHRVFSLGPRGVS